MVMVADGNGGFLEKTTQGNLLLPVQSLAPVGAVHLVGSATYSQHKLVDHDLVP